MEAGAGLQDSRAPGTWQAASFPFPGCLPGWGGEGREPSGLVPGRAAARHLAEPLDCQCQPSHDHACRRRSAHDLSGPQFPHLQNGDKSNKIAQLLPGTVVKPLTGAHSNSPLR